MGASFWQHQTTSSLSLAIHGRLSPLLIVMGFSYRSPSDWVIGRSCFAVVVRACSPDSGRHEVGRLCEGPVRQSERCVAGGLVLGVLACALLAAGGVAFEAAGLFVLGASEAMVLIPAFPVLLHLAGGDEREVEGEGVKDLHGMRSKEKG